MSTLVRDFKYGLRVLWRTPGFTVVVVLTLALGIGANTAIFSVINGVLLRPLPFQEPERLVRIFSDTPTAGTDRYFVNEGDLSDWRARSRSFEKIAAFWPTEFNLTSDDDRPERVRAASATANLFSTLGVDFALGRGFTKEEDTPNGPKAVLLSYGFWMRRFGGDPSVLGKQIRVQETPSTIVGVLQPGIKLIEGTEVWVPQPIRLGVRGPRYLDVAGRLRPGVSVEQARSELESISRHLETEHSESNKGWGVVIVPMLDHMFGQSRTPLLVLFGAVSLMLVIACANVANLQLARAEVRQREFIIRAALGASPSRIARQLLAESVTLAVLSGGLGLGLAYGIVLTLARFGPKNIPRLEDISIDTSVLVFTIVISVLTGALFGMAPLPMILRSRLDLQGSGSRSASAGVSSRRMRIFLVIGEISLAVVLVNGAALLIQSFTKLLQVDPGFRTENVIGADVGLPINQYDEPKKVSDFYSRLVERLANAPGVRSAGATTSLPLRKDADYRLSFTITGHPKPANPEEQSAYFRMVTAGYFQTMGIPLRSGRVFTDFDDDKSPSVVIINETLARRYWLNESPIGKRLETYTGAFGPLGNTLGKDPEIIGVVGDVRQTALDVELEPAIYFPHKQAPFRGMTVVVRATANPSNLAEIIRSEVQLLNRALPISNVALLDETLSTAVAQPRFRTMLLTVFAGLALFLASIGIYGITAYTVTQRIREIGIRIALGAQPHHLLKMLIAQSFMLAGVGVLIGSLAAIAAGQGLASLLFSVKTPHIPTLLCVPALFTFVTIAACIVPVWRALTLNPVEAIRCE